MTKNRSEPGNEQMLENLERSLPALKVFLAAVKLRETAPETFMSIPEDFRVRLQKGDPSVLPELLRNQPELFRDAALSRLEDEAFRQLLASREYGDIP